MSNKRIVEEVEVFFIVLNPMTANVEALNVVAVAYDEQTLMKWYNSLKVESYRDGQWNKNFKKGSKLEWYNPMGELTDGGILSEWVEYGSEYNVNGDVELLFHEEYNNA